MAPRLDVRERACAFVPEEPHPYFAQMKAYQAMPDEEMLSMQEVILVPTVMQLLSRPSAGVSCEICDEEIMNEREKFYDGLTVCHTCLGDGYYRAIRPAYSLGEELRIENSEKTAFP